MKKFLQISSLCLFALSSFAIVGCGDAEMKKEKPAMTDGDTTDATPPADGSADKPAETTSGGSGSN